MGNSTQAGQNLAAGGIIPRARLCTQAEAVTKEEGKGAMGHTEVGRTTTPNRDGGIVEMMNGAPLTRATTTR